MKHAKKLAGILLALVMIFALSTTAFAAQEGELTGGSITINDAVPGQIYSAYQILYLESYNAQDNAYAYKANSAWETWLRTQTAYVSFDDQGYVTWVAGADAAAFAKLARAEAVKTGSTISADAVQTAPEAAEGQTVSTVTFSGLKLGYYLVDTTLGTLCSLDTTNPNAVMEEKNEVPVNVKTVEEDATGAYGPENDADIGQTVNFKSIITAQTGAENYVFHDQMSSGLTFNAASVKVYLNPTIDGKGVVTGTPIAASNYTLSAPAADGDTFDVAFQQDFCDTLEAEDLIVVTYSAVLNENAVVGIVGNPNASKVSYGDSSNTKVTPPSETKTYTWDLDVLKYANGDETKVLEDAQFVLLNSAKNKVASVANGKITGWSDIPAANQDGTISWPAGSVLTTDANGTIHIDGLDADTYYLREVKAPDGYNKLKEDQEVIITGATEIDGELTYTTVVAKINNQSGTILPSTGGAGTKAFYVLGTMLAVGAAVLLVTKKRMGAMG